MEEVTSVTTEPTSTEDVATEKGKGKAIQEHTEGEEDSSDDDDDDDDDDDVPQVYLSPFTFPKSEQKLANNV